MADGNSMSRGRGVGSRNHHKCHHEAAIISFSFSFLLNYLLLCLLVARSLHASKRPKTSFRFSQRLRLNAASRRCLPIPSQPRISPGSPENLRRYELSVEDYLPLFASWIGGIRSICYSLSFVKSAGNP